MKSLNELHIGFIGLGNMGGAVAEGFIRAGIPAGNIYACGGHFEKLTARCTEISALVPSGAENEEGIHACHDVAEVADASDLIFIAVKPVKIPTVIKPYAAHFAGKLVVSVA